MDKLTEAKPREKGAKKEYQEPLLTRRGLLQDVTKTPKVASESKNDKDDLDD